MVKFRLTARIRRENAIAAERLEQNEMEAEKRISLVVVACEESTLALSRNSSPGSAPNCSSLEHQKAHQLRIVKRPLFSPEDASANGCALIEVGLD